MIRRVIFSCTRKMLPATFAFFVSALAIISLYKCNPAYEKLPSGLTKDTHSSAVPFSQVMHAGNFRKPYGNCDQAECHGPDLGGGVTGGVSCLSCHDDQWSVFSDGTHDNIKGGYYHHANISDPGINDTFSTCATANCHGTALTGSTAGYKHSCKDSTCHSTIPGPLHTAARDGKMHKFDVAASAQSTCSINYCHGGAMQLAPSCSASGCHNSSVNHTALPPFSSVNHGENYRFPTAGGAGKCTQCHGSTLSGGASGQPSCYSCHNDIWSLFSSTHTVNRENYFHHANIGNSGINDTFGSCAASNCHGANLTGSSTTGYRHSCTLSSCHSAIPAPFHTRNRDGAMHKSSGTCEIAYCHGTSHRLGPSCSQSGCHD